MIACALLQKDSIPFHVLDVDGIETGSPFEAGQRLGGYGEVFWVKEGKILRSMGVDWSERKFQAYTSLLRDTP